MFTQEHITRNANNYLFTFVQFMKVQDGSQISVYVCYMNERIQNWKEDEFYLFLFF